MFQLFFLGIFVYIMVIAVKNATRNQANNRHNNVPYQRNNMQNRQPNKYKTINSHYSPATMQGTVKSTVNPVQNDHNHAYEHKVKPIEEATVHDKFEDRKEAYRERKAQMKADLPKTSYSEAEQKMAKAKDDRAKWGQRNSAKNGDNGYMPNRSENAIKCSYCGANNIVPWNANKKYNCYFCREEL